MNPETLEARVSDIKQFVTENEGIAAAEIIKQKKLETNGREKAARVKLGRIKKGMGDWLFVQKDGKIYRWFSRKYATDHNLEDSINQHTNTNSNNPGTRAEEKSIKMTRLLDSLMFPGRA